VEDALMSGVTTMIGGGNRNLRPATNATTCTPGPGTSRALYQALEELPINFGLLGKGNASLPEAIARAGDRRRDGPEGCTKTGHHAAAIDNCLAFATSTISRWPFTQTH